MKTKQITNAMYNTRLSYQRINPAAMPILYPISKPTIIRIPNIRTPKFDTKRTLISQILINNPDATVQQLADLLHPTCSTCYYHTTQLNTDTHICTLISEHTIPDGYCSNYLHHTQISPLI